MLTLSLLIRVRITLKQGRQRTVLTMEDLSAALKEYGVDASRAPYYL